jgi:2'-5' RNA ligase
MTSILPPLILTVAIDEPSFEYFNGLRQRYFPAARNFLSAHLTLFHALPNTLQILDAVRLAAAGQTVFELEVTAPVLIGRGVVIKIKSDALMQLHQTLRQLWWHELGAQDQQKLWPHITVQNKVSAIEAQRSFAEVKAIFKPFSTMATGLQLWEYLNGPWKQVGVYNFGTGNSRSEPVFTG